MARSMLRGSESALVPERHGQAGHVFLRVDVRPALKDALVDIATAEGTTLKAVVTRALEQLVDAA